MLPKKVRIDGRLWDLKIVKGHYRKKDGVRTWFSGHRPVDVLTSRGLLFLPYIADTMALCSRSGLHYYKADEVEIGNSGLFCSQYSNEIHEIDSAYYFKIDLIGIGGRYYLPEVLVTTGRGFILPKDAVKLTLEYYGDEYAHKNNVEYSVFSNGFILKRDSFLLYDHLGRVYNVHNTLTGRWLMPEKILHVDILGRLNNIYILWGVEKLLIYNSSYGFRCLPKDEKYFIEYYVKKLLSTEYRTSLVKSLNSNYEDRGHDENNAKMISGDYGREGGGIKLSPNASTAIISPTYLRTGGIRYTYGVEFETAAGTLTDADCSVLNIERWGDRSIPAHEYVTPPISGDYGMRYISEICNVLANKTLVNNECALHVHVGGWKDPRIDSPIFNRMVVSSALKLGAMIEDDMFSIVPSFRAGRSHVGSNNSLAAYKKMGIENADKLLAGFLFGRGDNGVLEYQFGSSYNKKTSISRWDHSRYRWLNLMHCGTNSRMETLEIRIFPGTTSFPKVQNYILLSLAFLWAAENRQAAIWKEKITTLKELIKRAYRKSPKIIRKLNNFIDERKTKFKRK